MTQEILNSDRVLLISWSVQIDTQDVLLLLHAITRARQAFGTPLVVILSIEPDVAVPSAHVREALACILPSVLSNCQLFLIALAPVTLTHRTIRAFFLAQWADVVAPRRVQLCDSLPEAFECAQRFAPQEVLALQCALLKQNRQSLSSPQHGSCG